MLGAGAGTVFGVLALDDKSRFESHPTFSSADSANENAVLSDVCFGAAVALGMTSLVLLLRSDAPPQNAAAGSPEPAAATVPKRSPVSFAVSPVFTMHGGGAGVALRF